ncbi:hypothetical protein A3A84_03680 [Candidatus Collierbacteria bacterium RIFCSPLOWO2_01_FULL_50_23]|nr:MAG: hypothetical protein A3A84_03680 [Candidatus Collierbacteria bacterium RIFCSPLOWO2_01_FULL_50_23]
MHLNPQNNFVHISLPKEKHMNIPPITRRVLLVIYNPRIKGNGNRRLIEVTGWNDPDLLTASYIKDLRDASHGYANFEIVERLEVDRFPVNADGFVYDGDEYIHCLRSRGGFHKPDGTDYHRILADFDVINRINRRQIDEVWLFAFPYAGFWESTMAGPGAFWCNSPALTNTARAQRRFVIMGFSFERGVGEMLENMGHRAESMIEPLFRNLRGEANLWERFTRYDKTHPGRAEVGNIHFAPNSLRDYDWGNKGEVRSRYHTWKNFPFLDGEAQIVDASHWGQGDTRAHHLWWFDLLPHIEGSANGISYNWWQYVIDPNTAP